MAYADRYMNQLSGSSDLNAGTTTSDVGGGSDSPSVTDVGGAYTRGTGAGGTDQYTALSGTPFSGVTANTDWVSSYTSGATATAFTGLVTAVNAGGLSIDISLTQVFGIRPANAATQTVKINGAWASPAVFNAFTAFSLPFSTRVNIKAANYTAITVALTMFGATAAGILFQWRGYKTTPGDRDTFLRSDNSVWVLGTDIPYFSFTGSGKLTTQGKIQLCNLGFTGSGNLATLNGASTSFTMRRCYVAATGANSASQAISSAQAFSAYGCTFKANALAACINNTSSELWLEGCYFRGGLNAVKSTVGARIFGCVLDSQQSDAVIFSSSATVLFNGNTVYAPLGHGISFAAAQALSTNVCGNLFHTVNQSGKVPLSIASASGDLSLTYVANNNYYNIATTFSSGFGDLAMFDNTLEATDPLSSAGSHGFVYSGTTGVGGGMVPFFWNPDDSVSFLSNRAPGATNPIPQFGIQVTNVAVLDGPTRVMGY